MIDRPAISIDEQVPLAHISDIAFILILSEEVIEWLIARRANILRNGLIPLFGIGKNRVNIEDNPAEIEQAMTDHITNAKACACLTRSVDCAPRLA